MGDQGTGIHRASPTAGSSCPSCGAAARGPIGQETDSYREITTTYLLFHCEECDLQYFEPLTVPDGYYEDMYGDFELPWGYRIPWNHREFFRRGHAGGSLLDVGCGYGTFLDTARQRGFRTKGVELNRRAARKAVELYGLDVTTETVQDLGRDGRTFDFVTFFEVLELVPAPREFLSGVRRVTGPTTRVVLSVPNRNRTRVFQDSWDLPPHHLTRWTVASVRRALSEAGFDVVDCTVQRPNLRQLVGHLYYPFRRRLRNRYVAVGAAALVGLLAYVPFRLFGEGKYIYCEAVPHRSDAV